MTAADARGPLETSVGTLRRPVRAVNAARNRLVASVYRDADTVCWIGAQEQMDTAPVLRA